MIDEATRAALLVRVYDLDAVERFLADAAAERARLRRALAVAGACGASVGEADPRDVTGHAAVGQAALPAEAGARQLHPSTAPSEDLAASARERLARWLSTQPPAPVSRLRLADDDPRAAAVDDDIAVSVG